MGKPEIFYYSSRKIVQLLSVALPVAVILQSLPAMTAGKHYSREAMVKWKCIPLRPENRKYDFLHS